MKKRITSLLIAGLVLISVSGCGSGKQQDVSEVKAYPVKVTEVHGQEHNSFLEYDGLTGGSEVRPLSFKSPGLIGKIYVIKGQKISKGQKLIDLDTSDLSLAVKASGAQMDAAKAQYNKAVNGAQKEDINKAQIAAQNAQDTYNYCLDLYNKTKILADNNAATAQDLKDIKIKLDSAVASLNAAKQTLKQVKDGARQEDKSSLKSQYEMAEADYQSKVSMLNDAQMKADQDGYVVDVPVKERELIPAGTPVVLVRSDKQVVTVGLSEDDVKKVSIGQTASVTIDGITTIGRIRNVVQMADKQSGTYSTEIELIKPLDNSKYYIGEVAKVKINSGKSDGILIPINCVENDGEDYVYIMQNGHAVRKSIILGDAYEDKVSITGLSDGDKLIVEGMDNIKAGYKVNAEKEN